MIAAIMIPSSAPAPVVNKLPMPVRILMTESEKIHFLADFEWMEKLKIIQLGKTRAASSPISCTNCDKEYNLTGAFAPRVGPFPGH